MSVAADPVEAMLREEESADHAKAKQRGVRVLRLSNAIVSMLHAHGYPVPSDDLRVQMFHVIGDEIYGNLAIDIPTLREDRR